MPTLGSFYKTSTRVVCSNDGVVTKANFVAGRLELSSGGERGELASEGVLGSREQRAPDAQWRVRGGPIRQTGITSSSESIYGSLVDFAYSCPDLWGFYNTNSRLKYRLLLCFQHHSLGRVQIGVATDLGGEKCPHTYSSI